MNEAIRLDKHLVALIQCSRGEAQKYIEGGWVLVDGEVIDQPQFKVLEQKVELHTDANLTATLPRTMLLNLPEGFDVSTPTAPLQLITPETHTAVMTGRVFAYLNAILLGLCRRHLLS